MPHPESQTNSDCVDILMTGRMYNSNLTPRLLLVGGLYTGAKDNTIPFLIEMFAKFSEVEHNYLTRQIQYASGADGDDYILFMGIEVEDIEDIPNGMLAWEFAGDSWKVHQVIDGASKIIWHETITWNWLNISIPARPCGEFTANYPASWSKTGLPSLRDFCIVSTSYIGVPSNDDILIVDYDPAWPAKYEQTKHEIFNLLGPDVALRIEHYGSTSIPDMPSKPVIDILVAIPSWKIAMKHAIPAFNTPNIEYWFYNDHMCFIIRDKITGIHTHHIHMAPAGHRIWEGLAFRDYLITHSEDASCYASLKRDLVERYPNDREGYTAAKDAFVREITDKSLQIPY